ncbi:battenin isoform X2 [Grus americana]|uniref:battenin isoform X2 n=1 Tax=Grus americana TaxID=9117 RepID=UPI0024088D56|nr:battenin isoform X2 [Grus americana]
MRTHRVPPSRFPHASRMRRPAPGKRGGERDHVSCGHVCAGSHDPQTAMAEQEPLLPAPPPPEPPGAQWRNGAAFWLLGLCNNLPYVLMLSAARDILQPPLPPQVSVNGSRYDCNPVSTGAVLLADILPTLLIKLVAPFVVHLLPYKCGVGQRRVGAGGGHVPGTRLRVPQGRRLLLVVGDGGSGGGGGPGLWGAAAGGAAPPPRPAARPRAAAPHPAQLLLPPLPPTAPHGAAPPRRGADAEGEVGGGKGSCGSGRAPGARLLRRIFHQPGAAGAPLLPRLRPDPRRAVPLVPADLPGRRLRVPLVPALLPPAPRLGPRAAAGAERPHPIGRRGRAVPARIGRRLRHGGGGGAAGGRGLRQRLPQRGRAGAAPRPGVRHDGGVGGRHGRDRAGRGGGAGGPRRLLPAGLTHGEDPRRGPIAL